MSEPDPTIDEQIRALEEGAGFVDRSSWRFVIARGEDADDWLNDLLSGPVGRLGPGDACRSLLLSPTGHLRADLHVARISDGYLLVQDPRQPRAIDELLDPYLLTSRVELSRSRLAYRCFPGEVAPGSADRGTIHPSMLGAGYDVAADELPSPPRGRVAVSEDAAEAWRIVRGRARFPADVDETSIPAEAGLDRLAIDREKGCFLGQESVARVANLGHPSRIVRGVEGDEPLRAGAPILLGDRRAGQITSAWRSVGIARIAWEAREGRLRTGEDVELRVRSAT